jgi:CBS domain-containing protein
MKALEIMKTHVVKTTPDATLAQAVDLMDLYYVSGLPVIDPEARFCGLLLDSDILRALASPPAPSQSGVSLAGIVAHSNQVAEQRVEQFMRRDVPTILDRDDVEPVAPLLLAGQVDRMPVLDDAGRVIGMLHRIDVLQALFEGLLA